MARVWWKCLKYLWFSVAVLVISIAIAVSALRFSLPYWGAHKRYFEQFASHLIKLPVTMSDINVSWQGFEPVFKLKNVTLYNQSRTRPLIRSKQVIIGLNLLSSVWERSLTRGIFVIDGAEINITKTAQNNWALQSQALVSTNKVKQLASKVGPTNLWGWLGRQNEIILKNIRVKLKTKQTVFPPILVNAMLKNKGILHFVRGKISLKQMTASKINFILDIDERSTGQSTLYLNLKDVLLPQWIKLFRPKGLGVTTGSLNAKAWLHFKGMQLQRINSQFAIEHANVISPSKKISRLLQNIAGHLAWVRTDTGWRLLADDINVQAQGARWPTTRANITRNKKNFKIFLSHLRVQDVLPIALQLLPKDSPWQNRLSALKPEAEVFNLKLQRSPAWQFSGEIIDWQNQASKKFPAVSGLSGQFSGGLHQGQFNIIPKETLSLNWPGLFRRAFVATPSSIFFNWQRKDKTHWFVQTSTWQLSGRDGKFAAQGDAMINITQPSDSLLNLTASANVKELAHIADYLPLKHSSPVFRNWLDQAVVGPASADAKAVFRGRLKDYPFINHHGIFEIVAKINNTDIRYHPNWPIAKNTSADLVFRNRRMDAKIITGQINGIDVSNFKVTIPTIGKNSKLDVKGQTQTRIQNLKTFIQNSPLEKQYGFVNKLQLAGPVGLNLSINMPFENTMRYLKLRGQLTLKNNQFIVPTLPAKITKLTGALNFDQHHLRANSVKGRLWKKPIKLALKTTPKQDVIVKAVGVGPIVAIKKFLPDNLLTYISGSTPFMANLKFSHKTHNLNKLTIRTSLKGVDINLPKPFYKNKNTIRPMKVDINFLNKRTAIRLDARPWFSSRFSLIDKGDKLKFNSGVLQLGQKPITKLNKNGLMITGQLDKFNIAPWEVLLKNIKKNKKIRLI